MLRNDDLDRRARITAAMSAFSGVFIAVIPFFKRFLTGVVATGDAPSTVVLLSEDGDANLFGQTFSNRFFVDGFESGDTSAWSTTVP